MDFISEIAAGNGAQEYPTEVEGKQGTVYARKLTGAQKLALVQGKSYTFDATTKKVGEIVLDLGKNERDRHMMVQFCICDEKGKDRFKALSEVGALPEVLIEALYKVAKQHNAAALAAEDEPGES